MSLSRRCNDFCNVPTNLAGLQPRPPKEGSKGWSTRKKQGVWVQHPLRTHPAQRGHRSSFLSGAAHCGCCCRRCSSTHAAYARTNGATAPPLGRLANFHLARSRLTAHTPRCQTNAESITTASFLCDQIAILRRPHLPPATDRIFEPGRGRDWGRVCQRSARQCVGALSLHQLRHVAPLATITRDALDAMRLHDGVRKAQGSLPLVGRRAPTVGDRQARAGHRHRGVSVRARPGMASDLGSRGCSDGGGAAAAF